jgi:phospholipid transport system substrate-binding protein
MNPREIPWLVAAVALLLAAVNASVHAATAQGPLDAIRATTETVLAALNAEPGLRSDPVQLQRLTERHAAPRFDFTALARLTLGKHWRSATAEQKAAFVDAFHQLLVRTYSVSLGEYTSQQIEYQLLKRSGDARQAAVRTRILSPGAAPIVVDYSLYDTAQGWKIYDVAIEGVSLVTNYRNSFGDLIRRQGLDGLIASLKAGNRSQAQAAR